MTAQLGVNLDGIGAAVPRAVKDAGASWVRLVLLPDRDTRHLVSLYQSVGLRVLGVIARESVEGFADWTHAAAAYRSRCAHILDAIQIGNEPDHESPSSWTLSADQITLLAHEFHGFKRRIGPGLVSGHPKYVDGLDLSLFEAIAVHPYGRAPVPNWPHHNFGYVLDLLERYAAYGKPLWVTEYGTDNQTIQAKYVAEMSRILLAYPLVEVAFHFCWSDRSGVAPFGLLDLNDRPKAAHAAFFEATREEETDDMAITEDAAKRAAYQDLFQANKPPTSKIPFNPDAALCRHFLEHPAEMGSAVGPERPATDAAGGTTAVFQAFARGVYVWRPASGVQAA